MLSSEKRTRSFAKKESNMEPQSARALYLDKISAASINTRLGRTTSARIRALRTGEQKPKPLPVRVMEVISSSVSSISGLISLNSMKARGPKMCENYGHIIDRNWKGRLPRCTDCHRIVDNPASLRRADPISDNRAGLPKAAAI
jgi:hypothetical protein